MTTDKSIETAVDAELRRIEAQHLQRMGKKLDSVALSIVRPVVENSIQQQIQFERALNQLKEATAKISTTQRSFHSDDRWAAFWHGVGNMVLMGLAAVILSILAVFSYTQSVDYQNYINTVGSHPDYELYSDLIKTAQLKKKNAGVYLVLPPGENVQGRVGSYYDSNCQPLRKGAAPVLVPLRYY